MVAFVFLKCIFRFSASCSPDEEQYSGSEGVARGKERSKTPREKPRSRKVPTSKEVPRSSGTAKKGGLISPKELADKKSLKISKESARSKGGLGSPSRSSGSLRGVGKAEGQIQNSVGGKKRRKGGSKAKGKSSGSRSRNIGRPNLKQTPRRSQTRDKVKPKHSTLTPAPPLPITGRQEKEEQVVEYDVSLPELADYELVEYDVELGAPSLGPSPQPSQALLSALDP